MSVNQSAEVILVAVLFLTTTVNAGSFKFYETRRQERALEPALSVGFNVSVYAPPGSGASVDGSINFKFPQSTPSPTIRPPAESNQETYNKNLDNHPNKNSSGSNLANRANPLNAANANEANKRDGSNLENKSDAGSNPENSNDPKKRGSNFENSSKVGLNFKNMNELGSKGKNSENHSDDNGRNLLNKSEVMIQQNHGQQTDLLSIQQSNNSSIVYLGSLTATPLPQSISTGMAGMGNIVLKGPYGNEVTINNGGQQPVPGGLIILNSNGSNVGAVSNPNELLQDSLLQIKH